ncbi:MAG: 4-hydroxythreonine-4-phosphate dehydrogenase PdxA [Methylococcales bacterium]
MKKDNVRSALSDNLPRIAYTPGEPGGIGPDLCVLLAQQTLPCELIAVADPELLSRRAKSLGVRLETIHFNEDQQPSIRKKGQIKILPVELKKRETPGHLDPENSRYVLETIEVATRSCLDSTFDAMMTGPVHKGIINDAGIPFGGHTEFIAELAGGSPVMMLATPGLRVALATTHIPVHRISAAITRSGLTKVLSVLHESLRSRFGIENPRILVSGLNPHAGENGHLGREEIEIIEPALENLRMQGMRLIGPLPADTLFTPKYLRDADAVLAMYHDQGLPVLKYAGFGQSVNITLGLPLIRTSVDHGTALDLAGSGNISTSSAQYALQVAVEMSRSGAMKKSVPVFPDF